MQELQELIKVAAKETFGADVEPELTRPEEQFGDFSTNVTLQLAAQQDKNPREVAEQLVAQLKSPQIAKTEVAGPGFINFWLSDKALAKLLDAKPGQTLATKEVLVEYGNANPFKEMHIGHLYTAIVGESIARLLEAAGASVKRLSYHGDVGLHVAQAIWAMLRDSENLGKNLGEYYAKGAAAYKDNEKAAGEIREVNKHIYARDDPEISRLHDEGVKISFDEYDKLFNELNIKHDKRYLESQTIEIGTKTVKQNIGKVFDQSQGAIIYKGEKAGLHTRVFLNSEGLPTYEAKDLGLVELKAADYPAAKKSIVITANEQEEYFKVMLAALNEIKPSLAQKTVHLSHGFLSLTTGKMSSRTGNIFSAVDLLSSVEAVIDKLYPDSEARGKIYLGAVKYSLLKHRLGQDIVIDPKEAASLQGNSGPYLQYAYVRAGSILQKAKAQPVNIDKFEAGERSLARKISEYPEVVDEAVNELMPHHVATYLYELAQTFNRFYEANRVVGDPREAVRLKLVETYADTLKSGLELLNIPVLEKM